MLGDREQLRDLPQIEKVISKGLPFCDGHWESTFTQYGRCAGAGAGQLWLWRMRSRELCTCSVVLDSRIILVGHIAFKKLVSLCSKGYFALGGLQGLWCVFQGAVFKVLQIHQKSRISNIEVTMISFLRETNCRSSPWTDKTSSVENGGLFIGVKKQSPQWYLNGDCFVKMHLCQNCTENMKVLGWGRNVGVASSIYIIVTFYLLHLLLFSTTKSRLSSHF